MQVFLPIPAFFVVYGNKKQTYLAYIGKSVVYSLIIIVILVIVISFFTDVLCMRTADLYKTEKLGVCKLDTFQQILDIAVRS